MGVIEDTPKVLQDSLAPELRAIAVRLDVLEERFDERFNAVDKELANVDQRSDALDSRFNRSDARMNDIEEQIVGLDHRPVAIEKRFEEAERRADRRHDEVMSSFRQLIDLSAIQQWLTRLESKDIAHQ